MNIFDKCILGLIDSLHNERIDKLEGGRSFELSEKNPFLMDRETAIELGGYPKESTNIYVPSSKMKSLINDNFSEITLGGTYCIGNPELLTGKEKHISFGKIVFVETEEIPDERWYDFTQKELLTDSEIRLKDVMLRQSPTHYNINLKVGKRAIKNGLTVDSLAHTIKEKFEGIDGVKSATVIVIIGESNLYKKLLQTAEKIKEITLTLNHIFDGIDMDCGHCDLIEICNEVEGIRELHKKQR